MHRSKLQENAESNKWDIARYYDFQTSDVNDNVYRAIILHELFFSSGLKKEER